MLTFKNRPPANEVDRWRVEWMLQYERLMVRVTAEHGNPHQMRILEQEAEALTQAGRDRLDT